MKKKKPARQLRKFVRQKVKKTSNPKSPKKRIAAKRKTLRRVKKSIVLQKPFLVEISESHLEFVTEPQAGLPTAYGDNTLVLMVRDPWWIFAYWEATPARWEEVRSGIRAVGLRERKTILRIYDVTGSSIENPNSFFDIELNFMTDNWTVDVGAPDREWQVELGLQTEDGRFFAVLRSNIVRTPPVGVSDILDEEWMCPEDLYWKIFSLSSGFTDARSSLSFLKGIVSSEQSPRINRSLTTTTVQKK